MCTKNNFWFFSCSFPSTWPTEHHSCPDHYRGQRWCFWGATTVFPSSERAWVLRRTYNQCNAYWRDFCWRVCQVQSSSIDRKSGWVLMTMYFCYYEHCLKNHLMQVLKTFFAIWDFLWNWRASLGIFSIRNFNLHNLMGNGNADSETFYRFLFQINVHLNCLFIKEKKTFTKILSRKTVKSEFYVLTWFKL